MKYTEIENQLLEGYPVRRLAIVNANNDIWAWSPKVEDMFADNWELLT